MNELACPCFIDRMGLDSTTLHTWHGYTDMQVHLEITLTYSLTWQTDHLGEWVSKLY